MIHCCKCGGSSTDEAYDQSVRMGLVLRYCKWCLHLGAARFIQAMRDHKEELYANREEDPTTADGQWADDQGNSERAGRSHPDSRPGG